MLNSPAITELTTEDAPLNLIGEWLRAWFDGGAHAVGANDPVTFPIVNIAFNQSPAVQPAYQFATGVDTIIRVLILPRSETVDPLDTVLSSGKLAVDRVLVNFYVMAKHNGPGMSQESVQTVAKLLKAILTNPATIYDLGLKGVRMLSPQTPQVIQGADYAQRLVACGAQMLYPIRYGDQPVDQGGVTWSTAAVLSNLNVVFNQSNALVVNGYLMNFYAWTATVTLYSASLIADAPQTSPVVMELEINGALTGQTIAIPMGDVDTEVTAMSVLNVAVPAGNQVRWKVISAPAPTDSAWYVSLVMTVGLPSN